LIAISSLFLEQPMMVAFNWSN